MPREYRHCSSSSSIQILVKPRGARNKKKKKRKNQPNKPETNTNKRSLSKRKKKKKGKKILGPGEREPWHQPLFIFHHNPSPEEQTNSRIRASNRNSREPRSSGPRSSITTGGGVSIPARIEAVQTQVLPLNVGISSNNSRESFSPSGEYVAASTA